MREFMAIAKALADENRTRIVMFLRGGEMCVCRVVEMLGLAPSTVSKHLNILYRAGLIDSRRAGRWIYYRLPDAPPPGVREAIGWLDASLRDSPRMVRDAGRLKAVLKMDAEELCRRYRCGKNARGE